MPNSSQPKVLWSPAADARHTTRLGRFMDSSEQRTGRRFADYDALWRWSIEDLEGFWAAVWEFFGVRASVPYARVLSGYEMPGARWFEGTRLNYAEYTLAHRGEQVAVIGQSQTVDPIRVVARRPA